MVCGRVWWVEWYTLWVAQDDAAAFPVGTNVYLMGVVIITTFLVTQRQLEVREGR